MSPSRNSPCCAKWQGPGPTFGPTLLLSIAALLASPAAIAQEVKTPSDVEPVAEPTPGPNQSVRLVWARHESARDCASQEQVESGVIQRLGSDPFSPDAPRVVEGTVVPLSPSNEADAEEHGYRVKLVLRSREGERLGERSFDSKDADCTALNGAAVLAIALLIDPNAAFAPPRGPVPPSIPSPEVAVEPNWIPMLIPIPASYPPAAMQPSLPTDEAPRVGLAAEAEGILLIGWLPSPAVGLGARMLFQPGVERLLLSGFVYHVPTVDTDDGEFAFGLTGFEAGACYVVLESSHVALSPCGGVGIASMVAITKVRTPVEPGEQPVLGAWLGPRLVGSIQPFFLAIQADLMAAFLRPSYEIRGSEEQAFEPTVGSGRFGVGVGLVTP